MKVGLIYLPHPFLSQPESQAPIGLMYIAAVLEKNGTECSLFNFSADLTYEAIGKLPECDVYGITVTTFELPQANRFAYLVKERFPDCKIILGGPGTFFDEAVDWEVIDSILKGDGEITVPKMLEDIEQEKLERIYCGIPITDLDIIPLPARHKLDTVQGGNIFAFGTKYKGNESTVILTSRGCPFKCAFCCSPHFTKNNGGIRFRSPQNIYEEMKHVKENFNVHQFRISDDLFMVTKERTLELCKLIGSLDVAFRVSTRVKPFDHDIAKAMFDAGCKEISLGVESFDDGVLKLLRKGTTAKDGARAIEIAKESGMTVRVLFMIRTPGQTKKTVPTNIKWLERVPYDIIVCSTFVPLPGSDIWNNPETYDIEILDRNLDHYNFFFFGSRGENPLYDIIRLKGRKLEEVNQEVRTFRDYMKSVGKVNRG